MNAVKKTNCGYGTVAQDRLFEKFATDLLDKGYSINPLALPEDLADSLLSHVTSMNDGQFERAGIGRSQAHVINNFVRNDEICWINGNSQAGKKWLAWTEQIQRYLNRRLFLGLFSFESHFASYQKGHFYKRHYDAFTGEANRVISLVAYLNKDWAPSDGGELVLYDKNDDDVGIKVTPAFSTVVVFLSEEFPHEVLPASRERLSISGWFRVNTSTAFNIDPPQ